MTLREQLEARRRELGWPLGHLAAESGMTYGRVLAIFEENKHPSMPQLEKLAAAMGCEIVLKVKEK